jgi:hypothetical protein
VVIGRSNTTDRRLWKFESGFDKVNAPPTFLYSLSLDDPEIGKLPQLG